VGGILFAEGALEEIPCHDREGRKVVVFTEKQTIFGQGECGRRSLLHRTGKVRVTVVSPTGKGATLAILSEGEFFGEGSLAGQALRTGSATAMKDGKLMRIDKNAMMPSRWNTRRLQNTRFRNE
jgi:CRP-like cAMP-binding protein